jgi:hypothetical protein
MQSNMAATLNIDWLLDLALDMLAVEGVTRSRSDLIRRLDEEVLQAKPGEVLFHPFISNAGERGPFVAHDACAQFFGLRSHHRYRDLMRAVMEGLSLRAIATPPWALFRALCGSPAARRAAAPLAPSSVPRWNAISRSATAARQELRGRR